MAKVLLLQQLKLVALVVLVACGLQQLPCPSHAAVYKVGDKAGWTTIGHVDYKQWAATKTFRVGDTILFEYHPQFHNVMQVAHPAYQACNASFPITTHTTGNDSITITRHGHHFFICGVPGHCQSGQKVDINVMRAASSIAPTPTVPSSPSAHAEMTPSPSPSDAAKLHALRGPLSKLALAVALVVAVPTLLD
ncbi:hypothetical protein Ancab_013378 [Ancistrocladus abbreviatus]